MIELPTCRWRDPEPLPSGRYRCRSSKWIAPQGVTGEFCAARCHCVDHDPAAVPIPPPTQRPTKPPCVHSGPKLSGLERERRGLSHSRHWFLCAKGHGQGGAICTCLPSPQGCGGCPDYQAASAAESAVGE